jgi:hypothetical protein
MRETVVAIMNQTDPPGMVANLDSASGNPEADQLYTLALDASRMPPLDTSINVAAYGKAVREALSQHPAIEEELTAIFRLALPERSTLKFLIKARDAERLRWETLCDAPARFLAMSNVCAISRVTSAKIGPGLRAFAYPLRMAAFLSAAGIKAQAEVEKICGQVVGARANGLKLECTIYLGEQRLLDDIQKRITEGDLKDKGVTVAPIQSKAIDIENLLKDAPIQFLHFFCHGIERAGVQGLSLATITDHDRNDANGNAAAASIFLSVDALSEALALNTSIWITVLNSCSGAQVTAQLHSMALNVAKKGTPYAVGMAEPIDSVAATAFSEAFYAELFAIVTRELAAGAADAPLRLDLSPAVIPARKIIHDVCSNAAPDAFGRWLLPLLYERIRQPLLVQSIPPAMAKRIQEIARILQSMRSDTPTDVRLQILAILDKEPAVPVSLRPNRYGAFV